MNSLKLIRAIQIILGTVAVVTSVSLATHGPGANLVLGILPLIVGMLPLVVLEAQIRGMRAEAERLRGGLEKCAKVLFDAPGEVRRGYDISATATGPLAALSVLDGKTSGFTAEGRFRDVGVSVASHISTVGRQFGELHHTYSHVLVDVLGLDRTFRITKERVLPTIGKAVGAVSDVNVGDAEFDRTFVVDSDEALAKDVLGDETIRQRLLALQSQVGGVSQDLGAIGGMSVLLTPRGLALRWPGAIDARRAAQIRDLLLDMRDRILAHENRKAVRVGVSAAGGYRIATEPASQDVIEEQEDDERAGHETRRR